MSQTLISALERQRRINEWVCNYKGSHQKDIRTAFEVALRRAGTEGFWFHGLRHYFVTRMRPQDLADRVIMKITGHETYECFTRYDTISVDDLKSAVGSFEKSWHKSGTFVFLQNLENVLSY